MRLSRLGVPQNYQFRPKSPPSPLLQLEDLRWTIGVVIGEVFSLWPAPLVLAGLTSTMFLFQCLRIVWRGITNPVCPFRSCHWIIE